jgi:predicted  nucleic acid-binding Zn-ribbon protein
LEETLKRANESEAKLTEELNGLKEETTRQKEQYEVHVAEIGLLKKQVEEMETKFEEERVAKAEEMKEATEKVAELQQTLVDKSMEVHIAFLWSFKTYLRNNDTETIL